MLKHLYISQYALIDELELSLEDGFSVITGETGAGKSIIMGALALVMGARADSKSVREGAQKCIVEATFQITDYRLQITHFVRDFYSARHNEQALSALANRKNIQSTDNFSAVNGQRSTVNSLRSTVCLPDGS